MPFLKTITDSDKVINALKKFNIGTGRPLLEYHQAVLRGESPFSIEERELMAAYVSGLNDCDYCYGAHSATAKFFGIDDDVFNALFTNIDSVVIDNKLKPVLHYLQKLTVTPSKMTQADADAVYAVG